MRVKFGSSGCEGGSGARGQGEEEEEESFQIASIREWRRDGGECGAAVLEGGVGTVSTFVFGRGAGSGGYCCGGGVCGVEGEEEGVDRCVGLRRGWGRLWWVGFVVGVEGKGGGRSWAFGW